MILAELSLFPMDKGIHLSESVSKAVRVIKESGLEYQLTAMGTLIEGSWEDILRVVDKCYKETEKDSSRIYMVLKVDSKKDASNQIREKVEHVENKLT